MKLRMRHCDRIRVHPPAWCRVTPNSYTCTTPRNQDPLSVGNDLAFWNGDFSEAKNVPF